MAEAYYLTAAKEHTETRLFKVLERKKITEQIVIIRESSSDNRKPCSALFKTGDSHGPAFHKYFSLSKIMLHQDRTYLHLYGSYQIVIPSSSSKALNESTLPFHFTYTKQNCPFVEFGNCHSCTPKYTTLQCVGCLCNIWSVIILP